MFGILAFIVYVLGNDEQNSIIFEKSRKDRAGPGQHVQFSQLDYLYSLLAQFGKRWKPYTNPVNKGG